MSAQLRDQPFRIFYSPADDPLNNFYIPALSSSVRYDRSAGYFSSSALAVAASGVARLIQNSGRMRLLVGADLSEQDVEAIQQGYDLKTRVTERLLNRFSDPQDALLRLRLEVLAWMVAEGTLEIKVVLPRDEHGLPIPASQSEDYYHSKTGILTDEQGDQVGFIGSVNESETGWRRNYENFSVYFSWNETKPYLDQLTINFERLWNGQEKDWIALDIPEAVHNRLLQYRPARAPVRDPLEREPREIAEKTKPLEGKATPQERIIFQFLRDAPYLPSAIELGAHTSALTPWPHQTRVANTILQRFPDRALLCDEVGLGKTIEAGLVIRQLLISGRIKRCLILTPKSVLKQWQEELYEKFSLEVPRYDAGKYLTVDDQELSAPSGNPWDAFDVLLAGSQLAKRSDRRKQMLSARNWDLLVVDEAHHARRKDFREHIYRPNQLLSLLKDLNEQDKVASLLLMTATPMQVHPVEVWDLLSVLGMGGRWGADEESFLEFFSQLRLPFDQVEWEFVFDMLRDYLTAGGELDPHFKAEASSKLGPVAWDSIEELPRHTGQRAAIIKQVGEAARPFIVEMAHRHTPLARYGFRNTRAILREYERRGIMKATVPFRKPRIERVPMRPDEEALYDRIDEYISHFYHKYENERRGLGFIMTVYRRRLTSSFYAVCESLKRRLAYLRGQLGEEAVFQDDDIEQEELDLDISDTLGGLDRSFFQAELEYLTDFIQKLQLLSSNDSKMEALKSEIDRVFRQRGTVLVFTQYTDTMDYIRSQLCEVYGSDVACYSGRGGEVWNGIAWVETAKESVKNDFRAGKVRVMVCTDSASEGLNLQTCGVLINYDMPWNPMRVEQRIGRIDRIGQEYKEVWVTNYFYKGTIEDQIYQRLSDRIKWFEVVVGDLQPILAEVGEVTRRLAMLPASEREIAFEEEIQSLRDRLQSREFESLDLDEYILKEDLQSGPASPVSLANIEDTLVHSNALGALFERHPEINQAYLLNWEQERLPITFSPECFDAHPDTVRLLTYGSPLFEKLLDSVEAPKPEEMFGLIRFEAHDDIELRGWYSRPQAGGKEITTLPALMNWLAKVGDAVSFASPDIPVEVREMFDAQVKLVRESQEKVIAHRHTARFMTERAKAQSLLLKAAMVEIALGMNPDMFEAESYPAAFSEKAVLGLQRHRAPWAALLQKAYEPGLSPVESNPYFQQIVGDSRESLKARIMQLTQDARKAVQILSRF
jgi:superfamily II DNA or RNA helicase